MFIFIWNLLVGKSLSLDVHEFVGKFLVTQIEVDSRFGSVEIRVTFKKVEKSKQTFYN